MWLNMLQLHTVTLWIPLRQGRLSPVATMLVQICRLIAYFWKESWSTSGTFLHDQLILDHQLTYTRQRQ